MDIRIFHMHVIFLIYFGSDYTFQENGNPLRLQRALDKGVKVIMAHCASEGEDEDLDSNTHAQVSSVDLFMRLMDNPKYDGLLFGDISALTSFRRVGALVKVLKRTDIHHRLIHGSDYPVINNLITPAQSAALTEIFGYNPLLADFVLKRILSLTDAVTNTKYVFNPIIFQQVDILKDIEIETLSASKEEPGLHNATESKESSLLQPSTTKTT
ncbi:Amidohydrolase 2 [Reticulomyxa filosa]|uniref:Amidohydrolase 2 n=1 Tax=Reticulomyxa filosa TaxID=46433 RepID=X6N6M5_RETFI|nr:Amidohydrolase 2 [Reticulomyxa filosa]|eukprot:ETO21910.1 Amidohydrolase 2 [Reticulomyxa filosa]